MVGRLNPNNVVPTAPKGTSDSRAASTAFVNPGGGNGPRIVLPSSNYTGNIFYIANNGADNPISSGGGTVSAPFLTPTYADAQLASAIDFGGQTVTLQAVTGHAAFTSQLSLVPWTGGGAKTVDLAGGSIAMAGGAGLTGDAISHISGSLPGDVTIQNGTLSATTGTAIRNTAPGLVKIGTTLTFSTVGVAHMIAGGGGTIELTNGYTVSGGGLFHWFTDVLGQITDRSNTKVVTISGGLTFGIAFANAVDAGTIIMLALTFSPATGAFTGVRYSATGNGIVNSGNRGANFIPGSVAGTTGTGGQYL